MHNQHPLPTSLSIYRGLSILRALKSFFTRPVHHVEKSIWTTFGHGSQSVFLHRRERRREFVHFPWRYMQSRYLNLQPTFMRDPNAMRTVTPSWMFHISRTTSLCTAPRLFQRHDELAPLVTELPPSGYQ